jgi:hypothetical protein
VLPACVGFPEAKAELMRLLIVVPSSKHLDSAGVRIRYHRMREAWALLGIKAVVIPSDELFSNTGLAPGDHVLFSKYYSMALVPLVRWLREHGHSVGIDLFDDYFSQHEDARLVRYRLWLREVSPYLSFGVVSTDPLLALLRPKLPATVPIALVGDAAPPVDVGRALTLAARKAETARFSRRLSALWFGIGTNPFFSIGLRDLVAFSDELARLRELGWTVDLTILTNLDAVTPAVAAMLRTLPVRWSLRQWSIEAEDAALTDAFLCFLPVNGQAFSRAKTLNRAVSALSAGAQILSTGFPLYKALETFCYGSAEALAADLVVNRLRLRPAASDAVLRTFLDEAGAYSMAERIHTVLQKSSKSIYKPVNGINPTREAIIHGVVLDPLALTHADRLGILSIKSPFLRSKQEFDLEFRAEDARDKTDLWIKEALLSKVAQPYQLSFVDSPSVNGYRRFVPASELPFVDALRFSKMSPHDPEVRLATYGRVMRGIAGCVASLMPGTYCTVADRSPLHLGIQTPTTLRANETVLTYV